MGGLLHLVQRGGAWAGCDPAPSPFLTVPNVTAHPSTASVPITVLLYDGPLLCGFNVAIEGLKQSVTMSFCLSVCLSVCLFVCRLKRVLVGYWLTGPAVLAAAPAVSGRYAVGPVSQCTMVVARAYRVGH